MLRFVADENFNNDVVNGVRQHSSKIDIVRVQDGDLAGARDPEILAWAAEENRIVLSHDISTMTKYAYDRIAAGEPMSGLFIVPAGRSARGAIENIVLIAEEGTEAEFRDHIEYLPWK